MQLCRPILLFGITISLLGARALAANPAVKDIFDRDITARGISLIDWEGYMANPAIEINILPPSDAAFPVQAIVNSAEPRLYFNLPSQGSAQGPKKQLTFNNNQPAPISVAIFPARNKQKKDSALNIQFTDSKSKRWQLIVPIHETITEHAVPATGPRPKPDVYPITVDFSQDKTGFFKDQNRRMIYDQAVQDWAFYLAPIPLKPVPAGTERTWIFEPSGFTKSNIVTNTQPYTGYLLYAYGIDGPEIRSGGEPSQAGAFQISGDTKLPIRRSGGMEMEIKGNYNKLGWNFGIRDEEWWKATNLGNIQNDFYSIVHHEVGHALFFNPNNSKFVRNGILQDEAIRAYLGSDAKLDIHDHLDGILDPASLHGAFGNEYHGQVPMGRWLITKLDLLVAQAIGYKLREVDSLMPLAIQNENLTAIIQRKTFATTLHAHGGIPFYDWSVSEGKLPPGFSLNRFTGEISGIPTQVGTYAFVVSVRDYTKNGTPAIRKISMNVAAAP